MHGTEIERAMPKPSQCRGLQIGDFDDWLKKKTAGQRLQLRIVPAAHQTISFLNVVLDDLLVVYSAVSHGIPQFLDLRFRQFFAIIKI